jgi:hypothetical protein
VRSEIGSLDADTLLLVIHHDGCAALAAIREMVP